MEVSVAGHKIQIFQRKLEGAHGTYLDEFDPDSGGVMQIVINEEITDLDPIVFHELVHAVIRLSGWGELITTEHEEGLAVLLERQLLPAWREYKNL